MLNIIQTDRPVMVDGVQYKNASEAYTALKGFEGEINIQIPAQTVSPKATQDILPVDINPDARTLYRVVVRKWMTEPSSPGFDFMAKWNDDKPMPLVIMKGYILDETPGMYKMELSATPEPSSVCFHCGRKLTNPVSILYGIGPECGGHYGINPLGSKEALDAEMDNIRRKMKQLDWSGWITKSSIKEMTKLSEGAE